MADHRCEAPVRATLAPVNDGGREHEGVQAGAGFGRRQFLTGAAATAALVAAGCSSSGGGGGAARTTTTSTASTASSTTLHSAKLASDPFTIGVASGDPLADRVILWTRLVPDPVADDGLGAMGSGPVDVVWEVATDARFTKRVTGGVFTAEADHVHSVHVDAKGLDPATDYYYRFRVGRYTSPVGRTRTLPVDSPDRFALAIANCQMYESGTFAAYRHMTAEDVDLVAHLGDYIYELPGGIGSVVPGRASAPKRTLRELADFRVRYSSYKTDPDLIAVHLRHPFVTMWDDHEVANNYMGDTLPGRVTEAAGRDRKAAAYQAWWEHQPVRRHP